MTGTTETWIPHQVRDDRKRRNNNNMSFLRRQESIRGIPEKKKNARSLKKMEIQKEEDPESSSGRQGKVIARILKKSVAICVMTRKGDLKINS